MSASPVIVRDERTITIENASFRWTYLFVTFGLLIVVMYRSFYLREQSWDLLALVILSGVLSASYQGYHRVLSRQWALACALSILVAAGIAVAMLWFQ